MLAERLPTILPRLEPAAALEVTAIHSIAGTLPSGRPLVTEPPFCAPHHTATKAAIVGGGSGTIRPGAASLAHHGCLFLDEAPDGLRTHEDDLALSQTAKAHPVSNQETRVTLLEERWWCCTVICRFRKRNGSCATRTNRSSGRRPQPSSGLGSGTEQASNQGCPERSSWGRPKPVENHRGLYYTEVHRGSHQKL